MLRAGGNAVDAAVATSAVLMVTVPMQTGPGGDAIWLVRPAGGPAVAVNGSGRSGAGLDPERARASAAREAERGGWTVTVPGAVASWVDVLERYGTGASPSCCGPRSSSPSTGSSSAATCTRRFALPRRSCSAASTGAVVPGRGVPAVYSRLRQPELARCLRLLAETNGEALYRGEIASAIVDALAGSGGFLGKDDLAHHTTRFDAPLSARVGDLELLQSPPNSQGVVLLEALRIAETRSGTPYPDLEDADQLHLLVESLRAALADRDATVADPDDGSPATP